MVSVEQRHEAAEGPGTAGGVFSSLRDLLHGDAQRPEATVGESVDGGMHTRGDLVPFAGERQDLVGRALAGAVHSAVAVVEVRDGCALVDRVEGQEVQLVDAAARQAGVLQRADDGRVDGVLVLGARRSRRVQDHVAGVHPRREDLDQLPVDDELVQRQRARFVAAEDVHSGQLLDGCHALGDGVLRREAARPDGHRDEEHGGHGDRDASDEQHEQIVDAIMVAPPLDGPHDDDLDQESAGDGGDGGDGEAADFREHFLEMSLLLGAVHEVRGLAEERVHSRGDDHRFDFSLLARGPRVHFVSRAFGRWQRLSCQCRLVDFHCVFLHCHSLSLSLLTFAYSLPW